MGEGVGGLGREGGVGGEESGKDIKRLGVRGEAA
jgi:hypothetical protein